MSAHTLPLWPSCAWRRALLALGVASGLSFAAQAAPPSLRPLSAAEKLAAMKADAQTRSRAAQAAGAIDVTPPLLNKFRLIGDVDAQAPLPFLNAELGMSDDLSGVQSYALTLRSPSGQMIMRTGILSSGQKRYDARVGIGAVGFTDGPAFTRFAEPGVWTADSLWVYDAAYNGTGYDAAALAAMGRITFTVTNHRGYDITPPTLTGGALGAARLSLSTPPAGTWDGTLPFISATVQALDEGNGAVAGNYQAILMLCLPDKYMNCIDWVELQGTADLPGQASGRIRVWGELRRDQAPGRYLVQSVWLSDAAYNANYVLSKDFGGPVDMRQLFQVSSVTIAP